LGLNILEDVSVPTRSLILDFKNVIDVGCGDKFMVVITSDANFKGPNQNLRFFQSQNLMLMNSKWQNLINFSHRKATFVNNLELMHKDSLNAIGLDIPNMKKMKSLNMFPKPELKNNSQVIPKPESKNNSQVVLSQKQEVVDSKELISKKELVERSMQLIMDLDIVQKDQKRRESKTYAQGFIPHDHRIEHHRNISQHSKISNFESLREIQEESVDVIVNNEPLTLKSKDFFF